ncbi:MAG: tripartite tricarboxylate transporter TctB family protein [Thermodesulfobacteriota bacterium]
MEEKHKKNTANRSWKEKINFNTKVAVFFIFFSVAFYVLIPYQIAKPKLFMGRALMGMKPTLFPRLTMLGLLGLSVWYFIHSFSLEEKNLFGVLDRGSLTRVVVTFVILLAYALLLEPLGFVVSSALTAGALTLYLGNRNIFILFLVIIGIPLAIFFIFTRALHVSLPEGLLF